MRQHVDHRVLRAAADLGGDVLRADVGALAPGQHDRADHCDEQDDARRLEDEQIASVEQFAERDDVGLGGPGAALFLANEGEALQALDHLLQRSVARQLAPRRLRLECEGYSEQRDARLAELARELADAVRRDGRPRSTGALNAYERRLIHVALGEDPELRTFSVGLGSERRVTIARKDDPGA